MTTIEHASAPTPLPPPQFIRHMGHHWLRYEPPHDGPLEEMVAQWNPGSKTWTHSNCHDIGNGRALLLEHWVWIAHVPRPEIL